MRTRYLLPPAPVNMCDALTFFKEVAKKIVVVVTYTCRTFLKVMFKPSFTCVKSC